MGRQAILLCKVHGVGYLREIQTLRIFLCCGIRDEYSPMEMIRKRETSTFWRFRVEMTFKLCFVRSSHQAITWAVGCPARVHPPCGLLSLKLCNNLKCAVEVRDD
jgi:hypothetical protein